MRLNTIATICGVVLSVSSAFWYFVGWHAHRARTPDHAAMLEEARQALAVGDWQRAERLAGAVERVAHEARAIVEHATEMKEDQGRSDEMVAAAAAGHWQDAVEAYERIAEDSPYRQRHARLHQQARDKSTEEVMVVARSSFAAHDCAQLRRMIEEENELPSAQAAELASLHTRCLRERTPSEMIEALKYDDIDHADRARLLAVVGPERPRALTLLGQNHCDDSPTAAEILWKSLDATDRRAFAHGCALAGFAMPLR